MEHWSERLKRAAKAKGWGPAELARALPEKSSVSLESLKKYFQGRVNAPGGNSVPDIAAALNVDAGWLKYGIADNRHGNGPIFREGLAEAGNLADGQPQDPQFELYNQIMEWAGGEYKFSTGKQFELSRLLLQFDFKRK